MFEIVDVRRTDGRRRTPEHGYTISSPCEPKGSGELKIRFSHDEAHFFKSQDAHMHICQYQTKPTVSQPGSKFVSETLKGSIRAIHLHILFCVSLYVERTGAVVKPRTLGREVPGSNPPVAVRCDLEQVTYPQLLR